MFSVPPYRYYLFIIKLGNFLKLLALASGDGRHTATAHIPELSLIADAQRHMNILFFACFISNIGDSSIAFLKLIHARSREIGGSLV
jgi:hypothetical protein